MGMRHVWLGLWGQSATWCWGQGRGSTCSGRGPNLGWETSKPAELLRQSLSCKASPCLPGIKQAVTAQ